MSYDIGQSIDLTHLNRKVVADAGRKSFTENLLDVGTSFIFTQDLKAARLIPISFA